MRAHSIDAPDLALSKLMATWPETIGVFLAHRTHCVGCAFRPFHTVVDACREHRLDEAEFRAALRAALAGRGSEPDAEAPCVAAHAPEAP